MNTMGGGPMGAMLAYQVLLGIIPENRWEEFPTPVVQALAAGADWQFSYEAKERKERTYWFPTANPEASRRTGQYVNAKAHADLPSVEGTPYACTIRHESDEMLSRLLDVLKQRARKELEMRERHA